MYNFLLTFYLQIKSGLHILKGKNHQNKRLAQKQPTSNGYTFMLFIGLQIIDDLFQLRLNLLFVCNSRENQFMSIYNLVTIRK